MRNVAACFRFWLHTFVTICLRHFLRLSCTLLSMKFWPDLIAIDVPPGIGRTNRRQLTYKELGRQVDRLSQRLQ